MKTSRYFLMGILYFLSPIALLIGQNFAGPDTTTCESDGIMIGAPGLVNPEYCYLWNEDPAFVNGDFSNPTPLVKPKQTTLFTVTVTGQDFSFKRVDKVKVTVELGGVVCTPDFTMPDGLSQQIECRVTNKPIGPTLVWSLPNSTMEDECEINQNGVIGGCEMPGKQKVRIEREDDMTCFAESEIDVNVGTKEVIAFDAADPTRFAKSGEKLWLVGRNSVDFQAIPNDGFEFEPDQPFWQGDFTVLPNYVEVWNHNEPTPLQFSMGVGAKTVQVEKQDVFAVSAGRSSDLQKLINKIIDKIKPPDPNAPVTMTPVCIPLSPSLTGTFSFKTEPVNRWHSPEVGMKYSFNGGISAAITGKACLPPPYSSPDLYVFKYSSYFFVQGAVALNASFSKDESIEYPAKWKSSALDFSGSITVGVKGEVAVLVPGDVFGLGGTITGASSVTLNPNYNPGPKTITGKATVSPLYLEGTLNVWYLNPCNRIVDLTGRYNVMDPFSTDEILLYQFD